MQAADVKGSCASMNLRFEGGILDFINGIPDIMETFNTFLICYKEKYTLAECMHAYVVCIHVCMYVS